MPTNFNTFIMIFLIIHGTNIKQIKSNKTLMHFPIQMKNNFTTQLTMLLCNLDTKMMYVYFENHVDSEWIDGILQQMYSTKMCTTPIFILIR